MKKTLLKMDLQHKKKMLDALKKYNWENFDLDLGDLAVELYYDFIMNEIGPLFYNQGIIDAKAYLSEKVEDIDALMR